MFQTLMGAFTALTVMAVFTFGLAGYIAWGQGEEIGCLQGYETECLGYGTSIFDGFVNP